MALYLQELALLETTTNTLVKLVNVMEGVEGSAVFGYTVENVPVTINAGQTLNYKQRHTLDIRVVDDAVSATQAILTQWANAPENYRFKAAGYGGGDFLLWDEPVQLTFPRQRDGVATRRMLMTLDAVPGFAGAAGLKKLPVYAGPNLMGIYNVLGGSGTTVLNGFIPDGLQDEGVSGSNQTIITDGVGTKLVSRPLLFPFATNLTLSAQHVSGTEDLAIGYVTYLIDGITVEENDPTANIGLGRLSATINVTSNTGVFIAISLTTETQAAGEDVTFNTPAIRLGYETAWTP